MNPRISVVMSVWNGKPYIQEAVESILNQTFGDFEFLIVNDGSTDGTAEILDEYRKGDKRVRVFHRANSGFVNSLIFGCGEAKSEFLARMDADDIALPQRFERQVEFLDKRPGVALVGAAVDRMRADKSRELYYVLPQEDGEIRAALEVGCCFVHPVMMMRREAFEKVGGYRYAFLDSAEDYDLWRRIGENYGMANLPEPLLKYRIHENQTSVRKLEQQAIGMMAGQLSAKLRKTGSDPFNSTQQVSYESLRQHGISHEDIAKFILDYYLIWVQIQKDMGYEKQATELLEQAGRFCDTWGVENKKKSYVRRLLARAHFRDGRAGKGVESILKACASDPSLPFRWVGKRVLRDPAPL